MDDAAAETQDIRLPDEVSYPLPLFVQICHRFFMTICCLGFLAAQRTPVLVAAVLLSAALVFDAQVKRGYGERRFRREFMAAARGHGFWFSRASVGFAIAGLTGLALTRIMTDAAWIQAPFYAVLVLGIAGAMPWGGEAMLGEARVEYRFDEKKGHHVYRRTLGERRNLGLFRRHSCEDIIAFRYGPRATATSRPWMFSWLMLPVWIVAIVALLVFVRYVEHIGDYGPVLDPVFTAFMMALIPLGVRLISVRLGLSTQCKAHLKVIRAGSAAEQAEAHGAG